MSAIVTFYSYKGGVGRSMALANVATLLARRGLRVLMIDWDLEAPGIERYLTYFNVDEERPGLLTMLMDAIKGPIDYKKYVSAVRGSMFSLSLISSGRATDPAYSANLERFDWNAFFAAGGGEFLESARALWLTDFDVTLIDSRTGLSDSGGICTIQMPDIIVGMFTANHQSLYGLRDVLRLAQRARHSLAHDRSQVSVIPLASRFGSDFKESKSWLDRAEEAMKEFYTDWLPAWADVRDIIEYLKVPHVDYFGYGEKLAVIEQGTNDPQGMGFVYEKVSELIARDLSNAEEVFRLESPAVSAEGQGERHRNALITKDYEFDLYISFVHNPLTDEWLRPLLAKLRQYLSDLQKRDISIFLDYRELDTGADWPAYVARALRTSKLLLAIATPSYFKSHFALAEWKTFERRERQSRSARLIFPLLVAGVDEPAPSWFRRRNFWDFRQMYIMRHAVSSGFRDRALWSLAEQLNEALLNVPPFTVSKVVIPGDLDD